MLARTVSGIRTLRTRDSRPRDPLINPIRRFRKSNFDHVQGTAKLLPRTGAWRPHEVAVALSDGGERKLTAKHVIIATGATEDAFGRAIDL
jgi:pyruvate/2-oxoglutarate dehydrogenase complex dihydrolipoamide dehydrogenase (E3) component